MAGMVLFRADAAFYAAEVVTARRRAGVHFSLTVRLNPTIHAAIAAIDEDAWIPGDGKWIALRSPPFVSPCRSSRRRHVVELPAGERGAQCRVVAVDLVRRHPGHRRAPLSSRRRLRGRP
ncbi:hypothetical protein [Streptomyces sp. NBC_00582]|uniref:hypothetical protein n=1 Tax=Streptomyces sp. NBC_00582 TaxID=2975783 RepID=UPI002E823246|nr:hypothetical protein [Streptomyces sp. NBC_00582]WUB67135.1 hypothetical protein OG852_45395 [Streptomyces sp. NBC_00582]